MINASELRIGNFVTADLAADKGGKTIHKVLNVGGELVNDMPYHGEKCGVQVMEGPKAGDYCPLLSTEVIDPIPLTPEILENIGFENFPSGSLDRWKLVRFYLESSMHSKEVFQFRWENMDNTGSAPTTKIKYLHQLQNLYFALCGEELKVHL